MAERIFVSYAQKDRDLVGAVERTLRKQGLLTEKDEVVIGPQQEIATEGNVREIIKAQINAASTVVIIDSEHGAESQWVNYEAGMAAALGKTILLIGRRGSGRSALASALGDVQSIELLETP